jgi:hypothetical protein
MHYKVECGRRVPIVLKSSPYYQLLCQKWRAVASFWCSGSRQCIIWNAEDEHDSAEVHLYYQLLYLKWRAVVRLENRSRQCIIWNAEMSSDSAEVRSIISSLFPKWERILMLRQQGQCIIWNGRWVPIVLKSHISSVPRVESWQRSF